MTPLQIRRELQAMGLERHSAKLVAVLPLVEVAWADGTIQEGERAVILTAARQRFGLEEEGLKVLESWLARRPSPEVADRGRRLLAVICEQRGLSCRDVITLSREVALAAGGWFGFGVIDAAEAKVIDEIARTLKIPAARAWTLPEDPTYAPGDADAESEGPLVRVTFHRPHDGHSGATIIHYDPDRGDQVAPIGDVPVGIGRSDDNAVQIEYDAQVSRHHCEVRKVGGAYELRDLDSLSGTWVDGNKVTVHHLVDGQTVQVGSITFFFQNC